MKQIQLILIALIISTISIKAQDVTTVEAKSSDISDNLDLEAVASLFGEAENLEDFENKLNDPEMQISNLDLNEDGYVDYLRVVEASQNETHVVTIQAVIGKDLYQDVATIDVERDKSGETTVQVIGDVYMYGPDYIITPVYVHPPVIFVWFWGPLYNPWYSPYYWGYYPSYYRPWHPMPVYRYHSHVHVYVNVNHRYTRTTVRHSSVSVNVQSKHRRSDYAKQHPNNSFQARNKGAKNKQDIDRTRKTNTNSKPVNTRQTQQPVQKDWKPQSERNGQKSSVKNNRVEVPSKSNSSSKPSSTQSTRPSSKPSGNQTTKPSSQPNAKPATKQSSRASTQPSTRPTNKTTVRPSAPASNQSSRPASSTSGGSSKPAGKKNKR